jgi:hypothetical protein
MNWSSNGFTQIEPTEGMGFRFRGDDEPAYTGGLVNVCAKSHNASICCWVSTKTKAGFPGSPGMIAVLPNSFLKNAAIA